MELTVIIQSKIYEIRGQQVMLDRDLADLYGVETKVLNQSVKRNITLQSPLKSTLPSCVPSLPLAASSLLPPQIE